MPERRSTDPLEETSTWPTMSTPADRAHTVGGEARPAAADPVPAAGPVAEASPPPPASPPLGATRAAERTPGWHPSPPPGGRWMPPTRGPRDQDADSAGRVFGLILMVVGAWLLLRRFVDIDMELVLPIVAIAVGGLLLAGGLRPRSRNG